MATRNTKRTKTGGKKARPGHESREASSQPAPEVIEIPLPSPASFDPGRPLAKNELLRKQVEHFHEIYRQLPDPHKTIAPKAIETEGDASEYIREVTARLHGHHGIRREKVRKAP